MKIYLALFIIGIALAKESCDNPVIDVQGHKFWSQPDGSLTGFSVFHCRPEDTNAMLMNIYPLVEKSRSEDGCLEYNIFTNPRTPGQIGFIETWENAEKLTKHLTGQNVLSTFRDYYQVAIETGADLFGPWVEVKTPRAEREMVWYWTMNVTRKQLWDTITNWNNASWVMGKPATTILENNIQRRTWANGLVVDVRLVEKNADEWYAIEETVGGLKFPTVVFPTFFVNMSLFNDNSPGFHDVDPDSQVRIRYHTRFTVREGDDPTEAIQALKSDFVSRIKYYQDQFNNQPQFLSKLAYKNVLKAVDTFGKDKDKYLSFFEGPARQDAENFWNQFRGVFEINLATPAASIPGLIVVTVEDVFESNNEGGRVVSRIVFYKVNENGKIVSFDVYTKGQKAQEGILEAADKYYASLSVNKAEVAKNYAKDAVLQDPVGYAPPRTFDSVYDAFFQYATQTTFKRTDARTYANGNKVVSLVTFDIKLEGIPSFLSYPVQVLTFDANNKITHFQAFFKPSHLNFGDGTSVSVDK